jgi:hypothetical protein
MDVAVDPGVYGAFDAALASDAPLMALRSAVADELDTRDGDKATVYQELRELREMLRHDGRTADEDVVLDVMDFVVGWCSPHMKL